MFFEVTAATLSSSFLAKRRFNFLSGSERGVINLLLACRLAILTDVFAVVSLGSLWEARNHVFCMEMVKGEQSEAKG